MPNPSQSITHPRTSEFTLLVKFRGSRVWNTVSNPVWQAPHAEGNAAAMLKDWNVQYVEWDSSGSIYRVIRSCNLDAYKLE